MQAKKYSITEWAKDDRPREKLLKKGPQALSDSELLAILISQGTVEKNALELGKDILKLGDNSLSKLGNLTVKVFKTVRGIGEAKAVTIMAALEIGRRRQGSPFLDKPIFRHSNSVADFCRGVLKDKKQEAFLVLYLNQANRVTHHEIVSVGGITSTVVDVRIILKNALEQDAVSLIVCHNHPSGNLKPSKADESMTLKLKEAASLVDIKVLDHLIVSEEGYYSFADEGRL
jgi:DNA repair protein RadC